MAFPALETGLSGLEGSSHALHTSSPPRSSFVLRLTTSQVVISCVGVKHIPGASSESRVVCGPSPGYPHVWSKQAGHTQATMYRDAMQSLRNLRSHLHVAKAPTVPCPWNSARPKLTTLGPAMAGHSLASQLLAPRYAFSGGGVIGVRSFAVLRALVASTGGPPGASASSKPSASSSSRSQSSGSCSASSSASNAAPPS